MLRGVLGMGLRVYFFQEKPHLGSKTTRRAVSQRLGGGLGEGDTHQPLVGEGEPFNA